MDLEDLPLHQDAAVAEQVLLALLVQLLQEMELVGGDLHPQAGLQRTNRLFASSGYFKMLLSQSSKESGQPTTATFQAFSPETFAVILDFVYSGKLSLTRQNVIEVMSAASYLQMTDVIGVCKTFIKSSLDISEKEKDNYFSLLGKESTSNGVERLCVYSAGWRAEGSPDRGAGLASGNSWSNFSYYLAPLRGAKHDQRPEAMKKPSRPIGLL